MSLLFLNLLKPISSRVDRASASKAVDRSLIPSRAKSNTIKIGTHSFPLEFQHKKGTV